MKNICFALVLMLIGTFTFADTKVETNLKLEIIENITERNFNTAETTTTETEELRTSCTDISFNWMEYALDSGYSVEVAGCLGNVAYALCTGWSASYSDCF